MRRQMDASAGTYLLHASCTPPARGLDGLLQAVAAVCCPFTPLPRPERPACAPGLRACCRVTTASGSHLSQLLLLRPLRVWLRAALWHHQLAHARHPRMYAARPKPTVVRQAQPRRCPAPCQSPRAQREPDLRPRPSYIQEDRANAHTPTLPTLPPSQCTTPSRACPRVKVLTPGDKAVSRLGRPPQPRPCAALPCLRALDACHQPWHLRPPCDKQEAVGARDVGGRGHASGRPTVAQHCGMCR